jgi:DNA-directed RNA polymerase II subunit RPB2
MLDVSDNYRLFICQKCGLKGICNPDREINICKNCNNQTSFSEVRVPYACKLLMQELEAMSIMPRIVT